MRNARQYDVICKLCEDRLALLLCEGAHPGTGSGFDQIFCRTESGPGHGARNGTTSGCPRVERQNSGTVLCRRGHRHLYLVLHTSVGHWQPETSVDNSARCPPRHSHPLLHPFLRSKRSILVPASGRNPQTKAAPVMYIETIQTSLVKRARKTRVNDRATDQTKKRKLNEMHTHPISSLTRAATTPSGSTKKFTMMNGTNRTTIADFPSRNTVSGNHVPLSFRIVKGTLSTSLMVVYTQETFPNIVW